MVRDIGLFLEIVSLEGVSTGLGLAFVGLKRHQTG